MSKSRSLRRCAVYTRKSSEEGLDQAFNSLDAQREACEAYIKSQAHEGWTLVRTRYDDGGYSGGSMERPALKQLLGDVSARKVDVIVVYKVDRLTRSLSDFAKIVEILDAQTASFVSVTQSFNTTTSMGRLTLNVLLSFAQFEREVTGERIRDKIAASKRKGLWMGGVPPLGYDVKDRKLVVNPKEVEPVRYMFRRYLELGSVPLLVQALDEKGIRSKAWTSLTGRKLGGHVIRRGALYCSLRNRLYIGEIAHKGTSYPGEHSAIIDQRIWDQVQAKLDANRQRPLGIVTTSTSAVLTGLLYDDRGNLMSPTYAKKRDGRRYRYYTSRALIEHRKDQAGSIPRVAAPVIECLVTQAVSTRIGASDIGGSPIEADQNGAEWIAKYVERVELRSSSVAVWMRATSKTSESKQTARRSKGTRNRSSTATPIEIPIQVRRRGGERALVTAGANSQEATSRPNLGLIRAFARAWQWRALLENGEVNSVEELARRQNCTRSYARQMLELSFTAPQFVERALVGEQATHLTLRRLLSSKFPTSWAKQFAEFSDSE